ncbi:gap junction gamma-3 protein isoform X1 [Dasypus novemcinctus]|uniref:gap junction gamma-3 protein isoform X1 n=1 Tax=Dasypus novemcinctus TaxID=9361 RepID=UPI00062A5AD5|nr:gap junction gamma-3 protein-like isoform X1 [Dasypus novemcinctus]
MCGRFLRRLLAEESRHSSPVGRLLLPGLLGFRVALLAACGPGVFTDEQSEFECNTQQPGCKAACLDALRLLSPLRFWAFQVMLAAVPGALYLAFTLYHVLWHWEEPGKEKEEDTLAVEGDGGRVAAGSRGRRLLWAYVAQLGARVVLEGATLAGQYHLYGVHMPSSSSCRKEPCFGSITCVSSRASEQSIFLKAMFGVSGLCLCLTLLELVLLGLGRWWRTLKHKCSNYFPTSKSPRRHKEPTNCPVVGTKEQRPEAGGTRDQTRELPCGKQALNCLSHICSS